MRTGIFAGVLLAAAVAAGCSTPEVECRTGVDEMKAKLVGIVGSGEHKQADDPYVRAHTELDIAQTRLATGHFEGCIENLEAARKLLDAIR